MCFQLATRGQDSQKTLVLSTDELGKIALLCIRVCDQVVHSGFKMLFEELGDLGVGNYCNRFLFSLGSWRGKNKIRIILRP